MHLYKLNDGEEHGTGWAWHGSRRARNGRDTEVGQSRHGVVLDGREKARHNNTKLLLVTHTKILTKLGWRWAGMDMA